MFITKKHIPRRAFLYGSGVTLALPLLEAMLPAQTPLRLTAANPKPRFWAEFLPHGMAPGYWIPTAEKLTPASLLKIMEPLVPVLDQTVIFSGLWTKSAEPPPGVTGADHWVASAFLTASKPKKTAGADVYNQTTIDQMIAQKIGQETLLPSLQMAIEDPSGSSSTCGEGYSCAYTNSISWPSPTRSLPMEINPQIVFERLFGDGTTAEERALRRNEDRSILDSLTKGLSRLKKEIGPSDRDRLNQYLEDVREIERRLQIAAKASTDAPASTVPAGVPESFDEHMKLHHDLTALAFQGDITRVATMLGARDLTGKNYPDSGTNTSFHGGSHHAENPERIADYSILNRYHVSMTAYLAQKLKSIPDGDGTLLDHTLMLHGTNMGNSNQHIHYDVPHILIGGANGKLKGGRHLSYKTKTITTGNLLLSILDMYDIHLDSIGDSTGRLEAL